jgi:hypothetical protein
VLTGGRQGSSSSSSTSKASASSDRRTKEAVVDCDLVAGAEEVGTAVQVSCTLKAEGKGKDSTSSKRHPASLLLALAGDRDIDVLASTAGSQDGARGGQVDAPAGPTEDPSLLHEAAPMCDSKEVVIVEPLAGTSSPPRAGTSSPPQTPGPMGVPALSQDLRTANSELNGGASSPLSPPMPTVTEEPSSVFLTTDGGQLIVEQQADEERQAASERAMREL